MSMKEGRKKKICIITGNALPVPAVKGGAVETLLTNLMAENEEQQKADITIFSKEDETAREAAKNYPNTTVYYVPEDTAIDKVNNRIRRYLSQWICPGALLDGGYYRKVYHKMLQLEKEGKEYDAIVCEGGLMHEFRAFAKHWGKEKLYAHVHHHMEVEKMYDGVFGNIIAVSEFAKKEWLRTTEDKQIHAYTVYNCVNEEKFKQKVTKEERDDLREKLGINPEDFCVLYCGRIQEVKGIRELLEAFSKIEKSNMKLLIIGNADFGTNTLTPFLQEIKEMVDKDPERIRFTGYIDNDKLYRYYQCADLQIVPSIWEEAAGLVAIEGMLSGLPLIVTRSGGLIEYAPENVALWVERDEIVENLREAILRISKDEELRKRMQEKSYAHALHFSKSKFYEAYVNVFTEK